MSDDLRSLRLCQAGVHCAIEVVRDLRNLPDFLFRVLPHERIFTLNSSKGLTSTGAADRVRSHFTKTQVFYPAFAN